MDGTRELMEMNKEKVIKLSVLLQGGVALGVEPFYHGTETDLKLGDLLGPGCGSDYGDRQKANYVYLTVTLDAAVQGAELAMRDGPGRIYPVGPIDIFENGPNLIDRKFPGNPVRSCHTQQPLCALDGVLEREGYSPEVPQEMPDHPDALKRLGIEAING